MEVLRNLEDLLAFQRNGAAAPFAQFFDDLWLGIALETAHEVAVVLVDQREATELEVCKNRESVTVRGATIRS